MKPNNAFDLRESIKPRPSPISRCTTSPRPDIIIAEDAHHTTSVLHYPAAAPKNDTLKKESDTECRHHLTQKIQI
jgi:hypothetical protein